MRASNATDRQLIYNEFAHCKKAMGELVLSTADYLPPTDIAPPSCSRVSFLIPVSFLGGDWFWGGASCFS